MIDVYYWPTPNGWKISIALEEMELPYTIVPVNIGTGEQFSPEFLAISPNNRMPAIVDHEPLGGGEPMAIFESGAILLYLAEKTGKFMPQEPRGRYDVTQWVMWQMANLGPMLGQHGHFKLYAPEKIPYAIERYRDEANRIFTVLDERLEDRGYICGEYTIADMITWPWTITWKAQEIDLPGKYPHVRAWYNRCKERPGLRRGYEVGRDIRTISKKAPDEKTRAILFSNKRPPRVRAQRESD